jgi:capsule polysaccharide export protein KpsE/RkpR
MCVWISGRLDKRKERIKALSESEIANRTEMKRYELDANNAVHTQLWEIIKEQKAEISELQEELKEVESTATLQRPAVNKIYANLRAMRKEIESLNLMILSEEETNVFMRRFQAVKLLLDETEGLLP